MKNIFALDENPNEPKIEPLKIPLNISKYIELIILNLIQFFT